MNWIIRFMSLGDQEEEEECNIYPPFTAAQFKSCNLRLNVDLEKTSGLVNFKKFSA